MAVISSAQPASAEVVYGAVRCQGLPNWGTWPVWVHYAVVSTDGDLHCSTIMIRPSYLWLSRKSAAINAEARNATLFAGAIAAEDAAILLNKIFGNLAVASSDLRPYANQLYSTTGVERSWNFADYFWPLSQFDIRVGHHAYIKMVDTVPEGLPGLQQVEANARAFLAAKRAHALLTNVDEASHSSG